MCTCVYLVGTEELVQIQSGVGSMYGHSHFSGEILLDRKSEVANREVFEKLEAKFTVVAADPVAGWHIERVSLAL